MNFRLPVNLEAENDSKQSDEFQATCKPGSREIRLGFSKEVFVEGNSLAKGEVSDDNIVELPPPSAQSFKLRTVKLRDFSALY